MNYETKLSLKNLFQKPTCALKQVKSFLCMKYAADNFFRGIVQINISALILRSSPLCIMVQKLFSLDKLLMNTPGPMRSLLLASYATQTVFRRNIYKAAYALILTYIYRKPFVCEICNKAFSRGIFKNSLKLMGSLVSVM